MTPANDSWINWGDFIGANADQLNAYDARVAQSQADQQAAMNAGLAQLGTDYKADNAAVGDYYGALTKSLTQPTPNGASAPVAPAPGFGGGSGGQYVDSFGNLQGTPAPGVNELAASTKTGKAVDASYSALMASQNAGQSAFRGYGHNTAAPGWENSLYSAHQQYTDPWAQLGTQLDPMKAAHDSTNQNAADAYAAAYKQRPNGAAAFRSTPAPRSGQGSNPFGVQP